MIRFGYNTPLHINAASDSIRTMPPKSPFTSKKIKTVKVESCVELAPILGSNPLEFLGNIGQPTWIEISGRDNTRSRAIITLLHANEPSGLKALHRLLLDNLEPQTKLGIFIASVEAALHHPAFSHRYLPDEQDFNRCFGRTDKTNQHLLANSLIDLLTEFAPEAVIDTHNTSGHSEPFAVATTNDLTTQQVTQFFTTRLVHLDQSLGTLIEQDIGCPVVTVEFGGFLDPRADQIALSSLETFLTQEDLFANETNDHAHQRFQVLASPLRLQVSADTTLQYGTTVSPNFDITIFNTIDQLNFCKLERGTQIGWASPSLRGGEFSTKTSQLLVRSGAQDGGKNLSQQERSNLAHRYFHIEDDIVQTSVAMTIFMATTDPQIAKGDCLLYFCPDKGKTPKEETK